MIIPHGNAAKLPYPIANCLCLYRIVKYFACCFFTTRENQQKISKQVSWFPKKQRMFIAETIRQSSEGFFVKTQSRRSFASMHCAILYRHMQAPIMREGDLEENLNG